MTEAAPHERGTAPIPAGDAQVGGGNGKSSRQQTRYKGVWDAGYEQACLEAGRTLIDFLKAGGQFAIDDEVFRMPLAMRLGDHLLTSNVQGAVIGMQMLLHRARHD